MFLFDFLFIFVQGDDIRLRRSLDEFLQLFGRIAMLNRMPGVINHALAEKAVSTNRYRFGVVAADPGQKPLGVLMPIDPLGRKAENRREKNYRRADKDCDRALAMP